jgi:hypothetical protein
MYFITISYIKNIIRIFLLVCIFSIFVKKYLKKIIFFVNQKLWKKNICENITFVQNTPNQKIFEKNNLIRNKQNDSIELLKNKFGIKSTEKTLVNLKCLTKKPNYLNVNTSTNTDILENIKNLPNEYLINLKKILTDNKSKKIIQSYIYNKQLFNYFFNNPSCIKIFDLKTFSSFHKKHTLDNNNDKYNIVLNFYNDDTSSYIFVDNTNLIKIKKNDEYDKIAKLIESNKNIFLLVDDMNNHYITHGNYIVCDISNDDIKTVFFQNLDSTNDKNLQILKNFSNVKIFYYTSTKI